VAVVSLHIYRIYYYYYYYFDAIESHPWHQPAAISVYNNRSCKYI